MINISINDNLYYLFIYGKVCLMQELKCLSARNKKRPSGSKILRLNDYSL